MSKLREQFLVFMKFKNLSERTQESYTNALIKLSQYYNTPPEKLSADQIINFIDHLSQIKKRTFSTCNVYLSAFKLFYNAFLDKPELKITLPHRKTPKVLPVVLSVEEIEAVFEAETDPRIRTLLMTAYGTGMRVGELINLKVSDIDSQRRSVRIQEGKGKKDRYTLLPERLLNELRSYYTFYHPVFYLFYGTHM